MCLIVHKTTTDPELTREFIEDVHFNNSDGWGIGIYHGGKKGLRVYHDIETNKEGPEKLWALIEKNKDKEMVIHFRMKTHGDVSLVNVHPFEVSRGIYLMHNGVISAPNIHDKKSDTWHFANKIIVPLLRHHPRPGEYIRTNEFRTIVEHLAGTSNRLCLFDKDGVVKFCTSSWSETTGGMSVSNTYAYTCGNPTYKPRSVNTYYHGKNYKDTYSRGYYDGYPYDYGYEDELDAALPKSVDYKGKTYTNLWTSGYSKSVWGYCEEDNSYESIPDSVVDAALFKESRIAGKPLETGATVNAAILAGDACSVEKTRELVSETLIDGWPMSLVYELEEVYDIDSLADALSNADPKFKPQEIIRKLFRVNPDGAADVFLDLLFSYYESDTTKTKAPSAA